MIRWLQRQPNASRRLACPNCNSLVPVQEILQAPSATGVTLTLLACSDCHAAFFEGTAVGNYEQDPPGGDAALSFYLQQGADIGGIAMRLLALGRPAGSRYLEIGCGFGFGLDVARRALGWDVKGIDPSPFAAVGRKLLDLPIESGFFTPHHADNDTFDIVHASEFLEHVPNPLETLRALQTALRPNGVLLLTTPAAEMIRPETSEGLLVPLLSVGWHIVIQTAESLAMLLRRAGFENVRVVREGAQLIAHAGSGPRCQRPDRAVYRQWLAAAATTQPRGSDLGLGLRARLFRELAAHGDESAAAAVWSELNSAVEMRFGSRLEGWCEAATDGTKPLLAELAEREPLCLAGVLLLQAWRVAQLGEPAEAFFVAAHAAAGRLRHALRTIGSEDGDAEDVGFAAERELIICAAERGDPGIPDRIVAYAAKRGGGHGEALRRRCFVAFVNHGRLEEARELPCAITDIWKAADRMEIISHDDASVLFCGAALELQTPVQGRVEDAMTWLRTLRRCLLKAFQAGRTDQVSDLFWPAVDAEALGLRLRGREREATELITRTVRQTANIPGFPARQIA